MNTYAWKEQSPDPAREFKERLKTYGRKKRNFEKLLRQKYGSTDVKSLDDYSKMPVRVSQVSYTDSVINLHVYDNGNCYPISNTKRDVGSNAALLHWILHLCRKPWISGYILFDFIELVSKLYNIEVPWDFDLEHQSFPEDCCEKGGAK